MKPKVSVRFAWYDFWVGAYWDRERRRLFVCPLPTLAIAFDFAKEPERG